MSLRKNFLDGLNKYIITKTIMKPIPRHTHSIEMEFTDKRNKLLLFRATIPLNDIKYKITKWYKITKEAVALSNNVPVWQIKGSHKIIESVTQERILFEWAGGFAIDMPADATPYDYQIVLKQLEVIQMKFDNPRNKIVCHNKPR